MAIQINPHICKYHYKKGLLHYHFDEEKEWLQCLEIAWKLNPSQYFSTFEKACNTKENKTIVSEIQYMSEEIETLKRDIEVRITYC